MLGNPVAGHIQDRGEQWLGVGHPIVTSTFAEHKASGRALGIDIGLGRQGDPVLAMESGTVEFAGGIFVTGMPTPALVVRIRHPQLEAKFGGKRVVSGYAHLQSYTVSIGQAVARGATIGKVGMTGATAPHLHGGFTVAGVEMDWWPYLDQNQEDDMAPGAKPASAPIGTFAWIGTGHSLISPSDTKVRFPQASNPGPFGVFASYDLKDPATGKPVDIDGKSPPAPGRDQVHWVDAPTFGAGAYVLRADGTFTPNPAGGYTQAELDAAVDKAEAEASAKAASAVAAASVSEANKYR